MNVEELREEISIELDQIEVILKELNSLRDDVAEKKPTVREKTAASAFLAQFYGGVENILKRISRFNSVVLPSGDTWHTDLFKRFCIPPYKQLPVIFDKSLEDSMAPYRKFRHVVYHGYGFEVDWSRMKEGIEQVEDVYSRFKSAVLAYLDSKNKL